VLKSPTGISGFDEIAMGGIPTGRTTLLTGGPGSGKTVFALQTLVHGAKECGEPGIFVAFEQDPAAVRTDAETFNWELASLSERQLFFIDARPNLDLVRVGGFDISGMLALLQVQIEAMGAKVIVFDGIDILLGQMAEPEVIQREIDRLQHWLLQAGLTALITCKTTISDPQYAGLPTLDFLQYMVDCSVILNHHIVDDVSQRSLRIAKYRGSAFHGNAFPFLIGDGGFDVTFTHAPRPPFWDALTERLSSGLADVDDMLQGGYFRAACILLTGLPGTGKTTLSAAFLAAACARGEKALLVSFVSREEEIVRNMKSLAIDLEPFMLSGLLKIFSTRASIGSGETQLRAIRCIAHDHGATCIVIDPLTALIKFESGGTAPGITERLIDWAKSEQRTLVCTGLLDIPNSLIESSPLQIPTISDTWIHLTHDVHGDERRRALSIIKSRGTGHSNQVREFVLSDAGLVFPERPVNGAQP